MVTEKLLSFSHGLNVWLFTNENSFWLNEVPAPYIKNNDDPLYAIRKLVGLGRKHNQDGHFLSNLEMFLNCNHEGLMRMRTIEEDLLVWSAECPNFQVVHLTDLHVVVITTSSDIVVRNVLDGSHLRTIALSQVCGHDSRSACCHSQLNSVVSKEWMFIWVRYTGGYEESTCMMSSHNGHVLDLESGNVVEHKVNYHRNLGLDGLQENMIILSGSDGRF